MGLRESLIAASADLAAARAKAHKRMATLVRKRFPKPDWSDMVRRVK